MNNPKPDWQKINVCLDYLMMLDKQIAEAKEEKDVKTLYAFETMVFNVAFYEWALVYNEMQEESHKIIEDYLKKKSDEENLFGGDNEKF